MPPTVRHNMLFKHDDVATAHFRLRCVTTSIKHIPGCGLHAADLLLRLHGPWTLEFVFWGHMKSVYYQLLCLRIQRRILQHWPSSLQKNSPAHRVCLNASDNLSSVVVGLQWPSQLQLRSIPINISRGLLSDVELQWIAILLYLK